MKARVLVVDDEKTIRMLLKAELEASGFQVDLARDGAEALAKYQAYPYDAVVLDISMPEPDGLEVLRRIKHRAPSAVVLMMTAYGSVDGAVAAMKMKADDYITKPFDPSDLAEKLQQILEVRRKMAQLSATVPGESPMLLGESAALRQIKATIDKVKDRNTTVLITGESGTGKGVVAKHIHMTSDRRNLPFTHIDCANLPHNLIESELFGHEKGAFTSAGTQKIGKLEAAQQGTVFLDEIATLPFELQSKLLIVLQERYFERLGGVRRIPMEARIIAATNENLENSVAEGSFRSDLYYRLSIVCIECPPLRNRREDIPQLARHFILVHVQKTGVPIEEVDDDVFDALVAYDWPGNVRELENTLESAVVLSDGIHLRVSDLPKKITARSAVGIGLAPSPLSLENQELMAILAALDLHNGHREKTAKELGISRRALQYKLTKYNIRK